MADMSEMLKNFSSMMEGKEIPDNIKEMMSSLMKNNHNNNNNYHDSSNNNVGTNNDDDRTANTINGQCNNEANNNNNSNNINLNNINLNDIINSLNNNSNNGSNSRGNGDGSSTSNGPNIDMATMLKMQKFISAMNSSSNSSGANLLRSLKPYLKPSRQSKVDECIQLLNIEKVIGLMNTSGGDKK